MMPLETQNFREHRYRNCLETSFDKILFSKLLETRNSYQNSKLVSKLETCIETRNLYRNSKLVSKLETCIKTRNFYRNSKLVSELETYIGTRSVYNDASRNYL